MTELIESPKISISHYINASFSALNFELLCWVKESALRSRTVHEINSEICKKFNDSGIIIPSPQRDLHIYQK